MMVGASLLLAACGGGGGGSGPAGTTPSPEAPEAEKPFAISMHLSLHIPEPPEPNNSALRAIEEYTGSKVQITWIPNVSYEDRLNVLLSSNDLPDAVVVTDNKAPSIVQAVKTGMFWETGPYLQEFKNLSRINPVIQYNTAYEGKTYGLYRGRVMARNGFIVRKDWLDNLNRQEPKTIDDLYGVIEAFTRQDPDKDGKHNTLGLIEFNNLSSLKALVVMYGGPNGWEMKDGRFTPDFMTPAYTQALQFFRKLYTERLMNTDFAVANNSTRNDSFNKGRGGLMYGTMDDGYTKTADLYKLTPGAQVDLFNRIQGPAGIRVIPTEGWNGMFFFPKKNFKTEQELKRALAFFDKLDDQPMQDLFNYGVQGEHYNVENGIVKPIAEKTNSYLSQVRPHVVMPLNYVDSKSPADEAPLVRKYNQLVKDNLAYVVPDPTAPFLSATYSEIGNELDKIVKDATTKYIMGELDDAGWQKAVEQWRSRGGDKVIAEYGQEYAKLQKK